MPERLVPGSFRRVTALNIAAADGGTVRLGPAGFWSPVKDKWESPAVHTIFLGVFLRGAHPTAICGFYATRISAASHSPSC